MKKVLLEITQNSQENTCNFIKKETLAQLFSCEFHEISKNTFFYWTPLVAALDISYLRCLNLILCLDLNYDVL